MAMRREALVLWGILVILTGVSGLVLLIGFNTGFDTARTLADLLARDGSADPFTPTLYQRLQLPVTLLGVILLALCAAMLFWKRRTQSLVSSAATRVAQFMALFWRDARTIVADLRAIRLERREVLFLAGILLLALAARLAFIMQPFKHDEAYTVTVFANQPLWGALSDYHLPNNHLFHTLLVHLTYSLFGYSQWAVRLPSLLAGMLTIPVLYLLARILHGRTVAVIATASAAAVPVMIDFAAQARGYTLIILFSLLLFILGVYVRRHANRFAWALMVVLVVLGIYTIPIFYFSYASFLVWLGLGFLFGDIDFKAYGSRWHFVAWLIISGILTVLFTVLVYLPPVLRSGLDKVLPYQVSDPLTYPLFLQEVEVRLAEFLEIALAELPLVLGWIAAIGIVLSVLLPLRSDYVQPQTRGRVPLQIAVLIGTFGMIFALRAPPWARFLTFLVPLVLMWAAAGWVGLLRLITRQFHQRWKVEYALAALVVLAAIGFTVLRIATHRNAGFDVVGREEQVARFLQSGLQPSDMIVIPDPQDAAVWYYWRLYGFDPEYFEDGRPIHRVLVVIDPTQDQTLQSALEYRGPQDVPLNLPASQQVYHAGNLQVFELFPAR
jgi:hypothetical protein